MLAGAHVADRAGLLAVAGQPRARSARRAASPSAPQASSAWLTPGPPEHALERPDVEVLARMRAGHDRDLGRLEVERLDAAGLDQRDQPERLDASSAG